VPAIDADLEREVRAGITEYVCPDNLGFTGILKQRYTDFLVNEIGLDGEVLHLTSTEAQKKKVEEKKEPVKAPLIKEDVEEKMVIKEESAGADMQGAGIAGEATILATGKAEDSGEQIIGQQPATKEEPEEKV
jgi:tRNA pseudouridine13 synthase